ncbi:MULTISPECIES: hypothetical protein [Flavobacteriaceae]|uniref:hypothetical protein n=1 Tax=Flavobacteriaceae TaxID=49546 RepID=UPI0010AEBFFB|nr:MULTISPECIES: hypothetical protein [Flavobacteriaceae]NJB37703.1 hypothetical protein [Croceivirga sp. JEA036]TKD62535.1 hypothetical protein FBT53_09885 [Flavobacterium sp. ASW18X]
MITRITKKTAALFTLLFVMAVMFTSCRETTEDKAEDTMEEIEDGVEEAGEEVEDAAKDVKEEFDGDTDDH